MIAKPRIKRYCGVWQCVGVKGDGVAYVGVGSTPHDAYNVWAYFPHKPPVRQKPLKLAITDFVPR